MGFYYLTQIKIDWLIENLENQVLMINYIV